METDTPVRETERILTDEEAAERAARKEAAREARRKKKQRKKRIKTALLIVLAVILVIVAARSCSRVLLVLSSCFTSRSAAPSTITSPNAYRASPWISHSVIPSPLRIKQCP